MENIKQQLKEQYNLSIDFYNKGDYEHYFFHVRKSIELFGKYLIFDTLIIKNEPEKAPHIINGDYSFQLDNVNKVCNLVETPQQREPEGSFFVKLAQYALYYAFPALCNPGQFPQPRRIKQKIDTCLNAMIDYYNTSSEIVMHTADSHLDQRNQADSCSAFFAKAFNDLKSQISDEASAFFAELDVPKEEPKQNVHIEKAIRVTNDFSVLDDVTNRLGQSVDEYYIALLPEKLEDNYGNVISKDQLHNLFRLDWHFIVDLNKKTADGLYEQAPSPKKSSIRIITDNISEVTGACNLTNWMFAKGRADLGGFDEKATLRNAPKMFSKTFSKLVRTGATKDYIIFDFCDNAYKLTEKLFSKLEDVFDDWDSAANRCRIISFTNNHEYRSLLTEWSDYTGVQVFFVDANFADFLIHISDVKLKVDISESRVLLRGKSLDISEARERYHAAGIDFYYPFFKIEGTQPQWDFYSGAEITWHELENQFDVQRDKYRVVRSRITELIRTTRKTVVFTLRHRPGSGATTLSRRLGYDITKDDESRILSCTVVDIKNCSNLRITDQYLCQLSEKTENTPILAIVESKRIGREKFDYLVQRMSKAGKKIIFFYIEPFTGNYYASKENVVLLESTLNANELIRFEEKYKQLGLNPILLENRKKQLAPIEVIDFPLMLKDNDTSTNLESYVKEWMNNLPENLIKFCAFVGFVYKYSDLGVNQTLLKTIWKTEGRFSIMSYPREVTDAIKKLLIEETEEGKSTGIWRPRYNRFSSFILSSYKNNWESGISEIAKEFISLCEEAGELGSDDKDMLYSVFVIRKNVDYRELEEKENIRNKFSLLVKDLNDVERAESLFCSLVNSFPEDPVFRGHFARFLYEKATMSKMITIDDRLFIDAQDQLNQAFDINPEDANLHHMQGMLLRRRINALSKMLIHDLQTKELEDVDIRGIRDCLEEWVQKAYESFEKSIDLSPASPYGYAAESQLFREAIELGQKLLGAKDYSFCETDYVFSDYTEKLGNVLDLLEQVCYAFRNDGLSQILSSYRIYEGVRMYHQNLVGRNKEAIERYRKMYNGATDEKKLFYGNLLVKSIVYSKTSKKDTRKAYRNLAHHEREEIENVLEYQKNKGDVKSYETLFMLKLYSSEDYSLDDAIDLLKEWENQCTVNNQLGWGYLNACFYLAVCYCAKSIKRAVPNLELTSLAATYFRKSEDFSKRFDKWTVFPQCYLGERDDIHCIIDKNMKDTDADTVTGVIQHIHNNKGILKMLCGVEVTFNAKGFDILHDEGQVLRGVLGFSYSGPGLYDFRPESVGIESAILYDEQDETEITFEDLEKSYIPSEDLVEENETNKEQPVTLENGIKHIGYIDPTLLSTTRKSKVSSKENKKQVLIDGEDFEGTIIKNGAYQNIKCNVYPYPLRIEDKEAEFYEDEVVIFTAKSRPNDRNASKIFWYATNIRLKED